MLPFKRKGRVLHIVLTYCTLSFAVYVLVFFYYV